MKVIKFQGDWYELRELIPVDYRIDYNIYHSGDAVYFVNREEEANAKYITSIDINDIEQLVISAETLVIQSRIGHIVLYKGNIVSQFSSQAKHYIE